MKWVSPTSSQRGREEGRQDRGGWQEKEEEEYEEGEEEKQVWEEGAEEGTHRVR